MDPGRDPAGLPLVHDELLLGAQSSSVAYPGSCKPSFGLDRSGEKVSVRSAQRAQ